MVKIENNFFFTFILLTVKRYVSPKVTPLNDCSLL